MTRETDHDARGRRKPGAYNSNSGPKRPPRSRGASTPSESAHAGERIAKVMARAGLCSRRDAELWVAEGRVAVNGTVLDSPARNVTEKDHITVDGKPLAQRERTRLFLFNKPRGLVTTDKDPEGRPTIFEALSADMPRVVSIGRLDINTEGLLLLTNDGGLARVLELPATGWLRRYRVRAYGETDQAVLDRLSEGVTIDGVDYRGIDAKIDRMQGDNVWITMGLREGKNREIKRVLEHIGLQVNRLIRISYGPFQLGELGEGAVEEIRTRILKDQLGENLAQEAGADFEAPIFSPEADRSHHYENAKGRFAEEEPAGPAEPHSPDRKRKHVSKLRDERSESSKGVRKRTTRDSTQDRRGRAVTVERVVAVERPRRGKDAPAASRNARRFAAAAGGDKPMRKRDGRPGEGAEAAPYVAGRGHGRSDMARGDRNEERTERPARSFDRPERSDARPARSFGGRRDDAGAQRGPASGERPRFEKRDGPRPERAERSERAPRAGGDRPFRSSAASGERPRFEKRDGPRPERAPRGEGPRVFHDGEAPRPFRAASEERPRFEKRDGPRPERAPRAGGDRPFRGAAASGERPRFEKRDGPRPERAPRGEGRPPRFSRDGEAPRAGGDRPFRSPAASGERPRFEKRDGPRPERAPRSEGRPPRFSRDGAAPRAGGDRSSRGPASGERPRFEKRDGPRPERAPRGEGPSRFSRDGDRPRPAGRPEGKFGGKPGGGKPGGRPSGGRPGGDRPRGDRPGGDRPRGDRPSGGRPSGGKPGGKPGGRPSGGRPPRDKH